MHKVSLLFFPVFLTITTVSYSYITGDIESFDKVNSCTKCNLTGVTKFAFKNHSKALIKDSYLTRGHLEYYDFSESIFNNVNLVDGGIIHSNLSDTLFTNVNASHANFSNSYLINSHFNNVDLSHANLSNTNFKGSNFEKTIFLKANLSNANLRYTNITQQQLNEAESYRCAILPDGSVFDDNGKDECIN